MSQKKAKKHIPYHTSYWAYTFVCNWLAAQKERLALVHTKTNSQTDSFHLTVIDADSSGIIIILPALYCANTQATLTSCNCLRVFLSPVGQLKAMETHIFTWAHRGSGPYLCLLVYWSACCVWIIFHILLHHHHQHHNLLSPVTTSGSGVFEGQGAQCGAV